MTRTYGLPDLFALAGKLLAPLVNPLRTEFARRGVATPTAPTCTTEIVTQVPATVLQAAADSTGMPAERPPSTAALTPAVQPAEPLYVRRDGKRVRYDVAPPDATGERFRRRLVGGRVRYEPAKS